MSEVKSWPALFKSSRSDAIRSAVFAVMGVGSCIAVGALDRRRLRDPAWLFTGLALALGIAAAWTALRMDSYVEWFAIPPVALLAAELGRRIPRYGWLSTALTAALLSPVAALGMILAIPGVLPAPKPAAASKPAPAPKVVATQPGAPTTPKPKPPPSGDHCFDTIQYATLLDLPGGLTVSEIDLGPFVLANTHSASMTGPYHRMTWGILKAHAVLTADADDPGPKGAQAAARALNATYVLECRVHRTHADRDDAGRNSLQRRLDDGRPPAWLSPLSSSDAAVEVYRLAPLPPPVATPPAKP